MTLGAIGAAVIGTGFIGTVHVEALRRIGVTVHGVLGSTPERSAAAAERLGVARGYGSLEALLEDPGVDAVHVTSPNHLHLPQSLAALSAGKHVICEKPLGLSSAESAELVRAADASDAISAVNFNIRFYPLNQHVREVVAGGQIGEVRLVTGHYLQDWLLLESDWNWRLVPERGGALRAVGDIGSHWLDLVQFMTGHRVSEVMADLGTYLPQRHEPTGEVQTFSTGDAGATVERRVQTEDVATILVRFDGGARGALTVSQISPGRKNSLAYEIDGADAAVAWDSETPDHLWIGHRDRPNEILQRNPALMGEAGRRAAALPGGHVEGFADTFGATFRAVYADILAGRPSGDPAYATFHDGHAEMVIGDAIARSGRDGRWVPVTLDDSQKGASS